MRRGTITPWNYLGTSRSNVSQLVSLQKGCEPTHRSRNPNHLQQQKITRINYSLAEVTCGIICGCLPALPAFLRHISGLKVKVMTTSWRSGTKQPIPDAARARDGSTVVPPCPTVAKKSPAYNNINLTYLPTIGRTFGSGNRYHPWEELDELEYVVGDDKRQIQSA